MRKTMSDRGVAGLRPRAQRYAVPDPELRGHWIRIQPSGAKSFAAVTRSPEGKQVWTTVGTTDVLGIEQAREQARVMLQRVRAGLPAVQPRAETFGQVVANWIQRHVEGNGLRSRSEIIRLLTAHILPAWKDREFTSIGRGDIAALLDKVEDAHGARQADYCLNVTRSVMNWVAARTDNYNPPTVRGMRRQSQAAQARERVLTDGELRAIWQVAERNGTFGQIIRMCLLTAQRSRKVSALRWADLSDDGAKWTVPKEPREKETGGILLLPEAARAIIRERDHLGDNPYVFAGRGNGPFVGYSASKAKFDSRLPAGTPPWTIHDLRRTARSLMSRAGIEPDIAERVLGHAIGGIRQVYDRHEFLDEKAGALRKLAMLIDAIVHGRSANVLPIVQRRKRNDHNATGTVE